MTRPPATVLAFDFGSRRIGIAIGNTLTRMARPLETIDVADDAPRWAALARVIAQWEPQLLVVGVPVHVDGTPHAMTAHASAFAQRLRKTFALPVATADERFTTQVAQMQIDAGKGGRATRDTRDAVAAQLILQGWLDEQRDAST